MTSYLKYNKRGGSRPPIHSYGQYDLVQHSSKLVTQNLRDETHCVISFLPRAAPRSLRSTWPQGYKTHAPRAAAVRTLWLSEPQSLPICTGKALHASRRAKPCGRAACKAPLSLCRACQAGQRLPHNPNWHLISGLRQPKDYRRPQNTDQSREGEKQK